jgi:hypothetical protein
MPIVMHNVTNEANFVNPTGDRRSPVMEDL